MAQDVFHDPHTVSYDSTGVAGVVSISINDSSTAQTARGDGGTFTHFVTEGSVSGQLVFMDALEAANAANKVAASKNVTFKVKDATGSDKTVTLTNFKSGGVQVGYGAGSPGAASVSFVADSVTGPASS